MTGTPDVDDHAISSKTVRMNVSGSSTLIGTHLTQTIPLSQVCESSDQLIGETTSETYMSHEDVKALFESLQCRDERALLESGACLIYSLELGFVVRDESFVKLVMSKVCSRFQYNYKELSEEIRALLIRILGKCLSFPAVEMSDLERLVECSVCGLVDDCPVIKREACVVISALSRCVCSKSVERILESLKKCMRHNQWRVRGDASAAMTNLLFLHDTSGTRVIVYKIDEVIPSFLLAVRDKSAHVRERTIDSLFEKILSIPDEERSHLWMSKIVYVLVAGVLDKSQSVIRLIMSLDGVPNSSNMLSDHILVENVPRITSNHSAFCIQKSIEVLSNPTSDTDDGIHALKVMYIMIPHLCEPSLADVATVLAKVLSSDDNHTLVNDCIDLISEKFGLNNICDCIVRIIRDNAAQPTRGYFRLLNRVLLRSRSDKRENMISESFLSLLEIGYMWPGLHSEIWRCACLLGGASDIEPAFRDRLFDILVACMSADDEEDVKAIQNVLGEDVFDNSLMRIVNELLVDSKRSTAWRSLLCILKHVRGDSVGFCMPNLVELITHSVNPNESIDLIAQGLEVIHILSTKNTQFTHAATSNVLSVIAELLKWKPGETRNKIRKLALVCLNELLLRIDTTGYTSILVSGLIECMEDCWSPDNRLMALWALGALAQAKSIRPEEIYVQILERLDDSHVAIRIAACDALKCIATTDKIVLGCILERLNIYKNDANESLRIKVCHTVQILTFN